MAVVEKYEVLHNARRISHEFLVKLILGRRPPESYLCDHFSLDGRECFGDRASHESFLWTQNLQVLQDSSKTTKIAASSMVVCSLVALALKGATRSGLAVFRVAGIAMRLCEQRSNRWRNRQGTSRRNSYSGNQMEMSWCVIQETIAGPDGRIMTGNTCSSHGHVSSLGFWNCHCNVTTSGHMTIACIHAIVRHSNEKTTARICCQDCSPLCRLRNLQVTKAILPRRVSMRIPITEKSRNRQRICRTRVQTCQLLSFTPLEPESHPRKPLKYVFKRANA
ncbi:hypothetical protein HNQ77_002346 [Silvibacterium bohemicum]|uniref:Uncharacterized protein n=1 Tax=Silvibacterium bohemicum TaxID=1577686 RepID=A0A841K2C3_9BACT|nr:hypothetical protein [Silvibacterium bohemicum]